MTTNKIAYWHTKAAEIIARVADKHGVDPRQYKSILPHLRKAGVLESDCTEDIVEKAHRIFRNAINESLLRAKRINEARTPKFVDEVISPSPPEKTPEKKATEKKVVEKKRSIKERKELFGHSITSIIRWMGVEDWSFESASTALKSAGVEIAEATIRIQLKAGKAGLRGPAAELTSKEAKALRKFAKQGETQIANR